MRSVNLESMKLARCASSSYTRIEFQPFLDFLGMTFGYARWTLKIVHVLTDCSEEVKECSRTRYLETATITEGG